jgi:hypothetical protein
MSTARVSVLTMAVLAVLTMALLFHAESLGGEKKKVLQVHPAPKMMEKAASVTNPSFGYVTPLGSFDLKDGGAFQYLRGSIFDVELKATMYGEDANYYYFYETNFPTWRWAFAKNLFNGHYYVWWTQGSNNFSVFSTSGLRGSK